MDSTTTALLESAIAGTLTRLNATLAAGNTPTYEILELVKSLEGLVYMRGSFDAS